MKALRSLRRLLAGAPQEPAFPLKTLNRRFESSATVIRVFYVFLLFNTATNFPSWQHQMWGQAPIPLWPLAWIPLFPQSASILSLLLFQLAGSLAAAFCPSFRWIRIVAFAGIFEYVALRNSYGKIGHSMHLFALISFLLIFLPSGWNSWKASRTAKSQTLLVFIFCQFTIMLTYTLAGLGKLLMGLYQMFAGQIHAFHPDALAMHIAQRLQETSSQSLLGPWLIEHSLLAWPMMIATIYLQFFSVMVVLRPSLHKFWCFGLIMFHIFAYFSLTINFTFATFLLGLFFLSGQSQPNSWRRMLADLPLLGILLRRACPGQV